jgi:methyl-accepting chemotaxis protein
VVFGVTSLIGVLTLIQALRYKDEVVVFRDKIVDKEEARKEEAELAGKTTISLDTVKSSLEEGILKTALTAALHSLCKQLDAGQGALYISKEEQGKRLVELTAGYALSMGESTVVRFEFGEGLIGQVASTGQSLYVDEVPQGYITILSGLGSASPRYVLIVPVKNNQSVTGVIEIASFTRATDDQRKFVEEAAHLISEKILKNG